MIERFLPQDRNAPEKIAFLMMGVYIAVLNFPMVMSIRQSSFFLALALVIYPALTRREWPPLKTQLLLWAGAAVISLIPSDDISFSLSEIKKEILYSIIAFWLFFIVIRTQRDFRAVSAVILASATLAVVASFFIYFVQHRGFEDLSQTNILYDMRAYYSFYMISTAVFCLVLIISEEVRPFLRSYAFVLLPLCLLCVYIARLRAGYLAILLASLIFLFYNNFIGKPLKTKLAALFLVILIALPLPLILTNKDLKVTHSLSPSSTVQRLKTEERLVIWVGALKDIKERPVLGNGFGYREFLATDINPPKSIDAHNLFLNYALMSGAFGMLALFALFGKLFILLNSNALRFRITEPSLFGISLGGIMLLAVFLTISMTSDIMTRHSGQFFWSLMGIVLGASRAPGANSI